MKASGVLKLLVWILRKYIQNQKIKIKNFETYFWSKFSSRTKMFRFFLDLLEDSHCNLQWESSSKSKKNLKFLVRDKNFDQKYVSNFFIFIFLFCIYFPSLHTTSFNSQLHLCHELTRVLCKNHRFWTKVDFFPAGLHLWAGEFEIG